MNEKICRLCLDTISNYNCQTVEESLLKSLKLNINICKENVTCIECTNGLRMFSSLATGRAYSEDRTVPLSDLDSGVKLDPDAIKSTANQESLIETEIKCSFCTKAHGREDLISLEDSKENKFMMNMLERYISEMNLKKTEELLACGTCLGSLEGVLSVILKCLEVEEKISKYVELEGTDDKGQVELKKVQQYTFRPIIKSEIESIGVNELEGRSDQLREEYTTKAEVEVKCEEEISNMELIIKTEEDDISSERSDCKIKSEGSDCDGFQELLIKNKRPSKMKMFKCELCSYGTSLRATLGRHLLTHKSPSEMKMFKCELCSYEAKYKCTLKRHLLIHKNASELKMFKCEMCSYEAKYKCTLKRHLLTHKNASETTMFKCVLCPYETKWKYHLRIHLLIHKSPSEINMFKCELCPYEAKQKCHLRTHLLTHKSPSEINMFKCELCSYETKLKGNLGYHLLTHKSPSEIKMFRCTLCSYETKRKCRLKAHSLTHKNPSEIEMFKCELCFYETKYKVSLRQHLVTHRSPSEINMFKCDMCPYEAKFKRGLERHLLSHQSPSERKTFKCEMCSYEVKRKGRLNRHLLLVHEEAFQK